MSNTNKVISVVINPLDDAEVPMATGKIGRILFKEAKNNKFATHQASIVVEKDGDSQWVNMDVNTKEGYEPRIQYAEGKKGSETWNTLQEGDEVKLQLIASEYNGKTYYKTSASRIKVTKKSEGKVEKPKAGATGEKTTYKKDNTGVMTGHAVGGAATLAEIGFKGDLLSLAKVFHSATTAAKKAVAEKFSLDAESYDVGMSVGNAINSAVKLITKSESDIEKFLVEKALEIYSEVSIPMSEFLKSGSTEKPKEVKKEEKKIKVVEKEQTPPVDDTPPMDFDDSTPF